MRRRGAGAAGAGGGAVAGGRRHVLRAPGARLRRIQGRDGAAHARGPRDAAGPAPDCTARAPTRALAAGPVEPGAAHAPAALPPDAGRGQHAHDRAGRALEPEQRPPAASEQCRLPSPPFARRDPPPPYACDTDAQARRRKRSCTVPTRVRRRWRSSGPCSRSPPALAARLGGADARRGGARTRAWPSRSRASGARAPWRRSTL